MAAVTIDGKLYSWGNNEHGKLGLGIEAPMTSNAKSIRDFQPQNYADKSMQGRVTEIIGDKFIVQVECGYHHTACLTKDGDVYTWGKGTDGVLGLGNYENQVKPMKVEGLPAIVQIQCGGEFMLALDKTGNVYSWGRNKNGQLGTKGVQNLKECKPTKIK